MHRHNERGITLMELMIVMVVVAILASIAYPSYRQHTLRSNRSTAKVALTQAAQALDRCFTRFSAYDDAGCGPATALENGADPTVEGFYAISGAVDATTYTLSATPQGGQADDSCGTLTLTQTNVKGSSGGNAVDCWRR